MNTCTYNFCIWVRDSWSMEYACMSNPYFHAYMEEYGQEQEESIIRKG